MGIERRADWSAFSAHLDEALDLDEAGRAAWLATLREQDPALAERIGHALAVRGQDAFAKFLSGPSPMPIADMVAATLQGRAVGPYVIDAEIGRGGMGSVWRAHRADGRYEGAAAIKFVHATWIGRDGEQRFRTEGVLLGRLDHPHIARLIDAGVLDGTQPYLILEYVEGEPIDAYCAHHTLGTEARLRLFLEVLEAVAHAHSHLIVHRDLKPSNVLVTRDGTVKLLDFGIAKLLDEGGGVSAPTQASASALTPQYAAPEQLLGQGVTTATDVYALGLLLYVLLTGTHPVPSGSRFNAELVKAVVTDVPPQASTVAGIVTISRRTLAGDLDNILHKALKKEPGERYATVGAFAEDLQRYLTHQPVQARADTLGYRTQKFVRRHRGGVLSGTVIAVALITTSGFALLQLFEARAQRDVAVFEAKRASAQSELTEFLLGDNLSQASRDAVQLRFDRARDLIHRRFRNDPLLQAGLLIGLSGRYVDAGDFQGAANIMREAEAIGHRLDDPHLNADIACGRAVDAVEAGDLAMARKQEQIGHRNMERLRIVPVGLTAECGMATADIANREDDYASAIAVMRETMRLLEREGQQRTSRYTSIAHNYARSLSLSGDYRAAWAAEQSVMAIATDVGRDDSDAYYAMVNVGSNVLIAGGQPRRAVELLDATAARTRSVAPNADPPFYLEATRLMAESAMAPSQAAEVGLVSAAATAEKQGLLTAVPKYRSAALRAAINRGDLVAARAQWVSLGPLEARLLANPALRRDAQRLLLEHARLDLAQQHIPDAIRELDQAVALIPADRRPTDPQWRPTVLLRAEIEYATRDYAAAVQDSQTAVDRARAESVDPQSSAWIGEALVWRARCEIALGHGAAADVSIREALPHVLRNLSPSHPVVSMALALQSDRS